MDVRPKIILLTGNNKSALLKMLITKEYNVVAVVVPKSKKYQSKYIDTVKEAVYDNIPVITASIYDLNAAIKDIEFDLLFSCGYQFFIPKEVYGRAKLAVNFHPALLPKHRGKYLNYILINRDEYSGITAHVIDDSFDTGAIILQKKFKTSPFDTIYSLYRKSSELEIELMEELIQKYIAGDIAFKEQNETEASSYFDKRTPENSEIDPKKSILDLFYEIRAFDSELYPAFFFMEGQKVYIKIFRKNKLNDEIDMI